MLLYCVWCMTSIVYHVIHNLVNDSLYCTWFYLANQFMHALILHKCLYVIFEGHTILETQWNEGSHSRSLVSFKHKWHHLTTAKFNFNIDTLLLQCSSCCETDCFVEHPHIYLFICMVATVPYNVSSQSFLLNKSTGTVSIFYSVFCNYTLGLSYYIFTLSEIVAHAQLNFARVLSGC